MWLCGLKFDGISAVRAYMQMHDTVLVLMSLTGGHVPLCPYCTGWPAHERVPSGPPAGQDACCLPQLQVQQQWQSATAKLILALS